MSDQQNSVEVPFQSPLLPLLLDHGWSHPTSSAAKAFGFHDEFSRKEAAAPTHLSRPLGTDRREFLPGGGVAQIYNARSLPALPNYFRRYLRIRVSS